MNYYPESVLMSKAGDLFTTTKRKAIDAASTAADTTAYFAGSALNTAANVTASAAIGVASKIPSVTARFIEGAANMEKNSLFSKPTIVVPDVPVSNVPDVSISNIVSEPDVPISNIVSEPDDEFADASDVGPIITTSPWYYSEAKKSFISKSFVSPETYEKIFMIFLLALFIFSSVEFMAIPSQDDCVKSFPQKIYIAALVVILLLVPTIIFTIISGYYNIIFGYVLALLYFLSIILMYVKSGCSYGDFKYIKIIFLCILGIFLFYNKFNLV